MTMLFVLTVNSNVNSVEKYNSMKGFNLVVYAYKCLATNHLEIGNHVRKLP